MTSLDDLVRATLAERARDVDSLVAIAPGPRPRPARRWVAVGAVGVLAAAILTVVVLIAPWRATTARDAAPADPTAGTQWVSYRGITLTVPASWPVHAASGCGPLPVNGVTVSGPRVASACPVPEGPQEQATTQIILRAADTTPARERLTVAGREAFRRPVSGEDNPWSLWAVWPVETVVTLPDVGVDLVVLTTSEAAVQGVLADVEFLAVDHLGCTAEASYVGSSSLVDTRLDVPASGPVVVCEYASPPPGPTYLIGSRVLRPSEAEALRAKVTSWPPIPGGGAAGPLAPTPGLLLYRFTNPSGVTIVAAVRSAVSVEFGEGDDKAHVLDGTDVPTAYPTR